MDRYILLDAQDWMTSTILNELWSEILPRPAGPVIFEPGEGPILPAG